MTHQTPKIIASLFICLVTLLQAQAIDIENDTLVLDGQANYSSEFFRDRVLHNSMGSFLDNYSDYVVFQTTTHGDFHTPDQTVISVQGSSYRWNKYYLDGFRIDNRIQPGSYLYEQDMYQHSLNLNTNSSAFYFTKDKKVENGLLVRYNKGGLGGISAGSEWLFHLESATALETVIKPVNYRRHITGQGTLALDYNIKHQGKDFAQHLYLDWGERQLVDVDYTTENSDFYEEYNKAELSGELPTLSLELFDNLHYAIAYSYRDRLNHEFYYSKNETGTQQKLSASIYGKRQRKDKQLTTGLTLANNNIEHNTPNFNRNHMDIFGESLDPFYADANTTELSHSFAFEQKITSNLNFTVENYNSVIISNPTQSLSQNGLYFESQVSPLDDSWKTEDDPYYTSLYVYNNKSNAFSSGLLENSAGFNYHKAVSDKLTTEAELYGTFDGMLIKNKSITRLNWEGQIRLLWTPNAHFSTALNLGRQRINFHYDMVKYLSDDYLNQTINYWDDNNADKQVQQGEQDNYFMSRGGNYRSLEKGIKQPIYYYMQWPIIINVNKKNKFTITTSYKKYYHLWNTEFKDDVNSYGQFEQDGNQSIFFFDKGQAPEYVMNSRMPELMSVDQKNPFLTNTPFAITNIFKYSYTSEKVFLSVSWVSQFMMNVSNLGNSPQENNMEVYSDLMANPNTQIKSLGRPQQDRGYLARLLWGYKFNPKFKASFLLKFIDGQPFSKYDTRLSKDTEGNTQIATWRYLPNSTAPLYDDWGNREDFGINTELRLAYTFTIKETDVEVNFAGYNLYDFGYEIISTGFDLPSERNRNSIEVCAPRGMMITTKWAF